MDDTPRRLGGDDMAGRGSEEVSGRSDESTRGYAATGPAEPTADADVNRRTNEIRRDIEQTREELSETIDAIQEKLRPANVVSSAADTIKHATTERVRHMAQSAGNAASSMMYGGRERSGGFVDSIRDNPYPAALIGIGAAWMLMANRSGRSDDRWPPRGSRFGSATSGRDRDYTSTSDRANIRNVGSEYGSDYSRTGYSRTRSSYDYEEREFSSGTGFLDRVRSNPVPAALAGIGLGWLAFAQGDEDRGDYDNYDRSRYSTQNEDDRSTMSEMSEKVSEAASGMAESAQEYTRDAAQRARRTGRRAQNELQRLTHENPLAVGAGALLLGAIVGLALPETERENEMLGETRDALLDKTQQMAREATSRAQDAAADLVSDAASRIVGGKTE